MEVKQVLGSVGMGADDARGRRRCEAYVEGRVLELVCRRSREALSEEWRRVRRGWYLGRAGLGQRLEAWVAKAVAGRARRSFSGEARQAHDEAAAGAMLEERHWGQVSGVLM